MEWPAQKITKKNVESLIPYDRNARTHTDAQINKIAASITEWGFTNPILIDEGGGIIAGHGRLLAAKNLGLKMVPTITARGWTDAQKRAYIIADNKLALDAGWHEDLLKIELQEIEGLDFDLNLIGFDASELDDLLSSTETTEGLTDEDAVPETPQTPATTRGDVWVLGHHRLMCGDSTSIDAVKKLMDGRLADMWLTDPPYNVAYEGGTKDALTIINDEMDDSSFRQFLCDAYIAADASMTPGAVFYIWHADSEGYNFRGPQGTLGGRSASA